MKQKDLSLILVVVFISAILSVFLSKALFASPKNRQQQVDVVKPISTSFPAPDSRYLNTQSIDPTVVITIGNSANSNPFNDTAPQ